ncbi:hypothetical protein EYM_05205 [Ignicoccus islandicus DSM 13165]|uniref:T4 RNA ligase 1-like N-terminal domain-containing protein n=1 Tax=Ignicoccus islandicus DSM 13165 TaxID=940295 RepID=A0A0U3FL60_9CREN|nr:RNA ligase [Ignicoccus islandicus]ALU12566.1 hypothetical protein EYM_05205 [Ignicoccus islandicus DSM 13165]
MSNALYEALLALWLGEEPNYEEVLGAQGDELQVRKLISSLSVRCYEVNGKRLCVYSYRRPPPPIPLLVDARGTVIEWSKEGPRLIAYPFHKFYNVGEYERPSGKPLKVFEKLDGTMISAFEYEGEVFAATRKRLWIDSPFARVAKEMLSETDLKGYTYVYELIGPGSGSAWMGEEEHLRRDMEWKLVPLARRDMKTLALYPLEGPREFRVSDLDELKDTIERINVEGAVLWYEIGKVKPKMFKIKSTNYVKLMKLINLGYEGLARIILMNKLDDVLPYLSDEVRERALMVQRKLDELTKAVLRGAFEDEVVKEWLQIDPTRAIEEAVVICLRGGCRDLLQ